MKVHTAVLDLLKDSVEWRRFFKRCCETSPLRLRSQAWQFRDDLLDRDQSFALAEIEDSLMSLARKFFPESLGAEWYTQWADKLTKDAMAHLQKHYAGLTAADKEALDLFSQDPREERMYDAGINNDPSSFRATLKEWERVSLEAIENLRKPKTGRSSGEMGRVREFAADAAPGRQEVPGCSRDDKALKVRKPRERRLR